ncbi:MAG TPA: hypothetical protein VHP99_09095, partial [Pyrinomonadaceae bacterium]|nr:hypothetical protein [Pyrinomonadaceae bacterium]
LRPSTFIFHRSCLNFKPMTGAQPSRLPRFRECKRSLLGVNFGGDGRTAVGLPNLTHLAVPHGLQYFIAVEGTYPATYNPAQEMAEEDRRGMFRPPSELCP